MAAPPSNTTPVGPDTLITVKVIFNGCNRRFKLALRDLGANVLPQKLRFLLSIHPEAEVNFERFSDSAGAYVLLDSTNPAIYKQLYRAAKAKLKLRLRATITKTAPCDTEDGNISKATSNQSPEVNPQCAIPRVASGSRQSYLETVLSYPAAQSKPVPSFRSFQNCTMPIPESVMMAGIGNEQSSQSNTMKPESLAKGISSPLDKLYPGPFSIDCNECHKSIPNEHFHCSICEDGDFDLCQNCVDSGVTCDGDDHWLIKRFIQGGIIVPSRTEKVPPRRVEFKHSFFSEPDVENSSSAMISKPSETRMCNNCFDKTSVDCLVTCEDCREVHFCFSCLQLGQHGHNPAHTFRLVNERQVIRLPVTSLLPAGRGVAHEAICDGCDQYIIGVRHKCLSCPDWDYCSKCVANAEYIHPGHRFAPLYEPIASPISRTVCHYGIHCDGPLCATRDSKAYIKGVRYKCAVCHDTDFCANCETVPTNHHNKSHPLIKFITPVRNVSITTISEDGNGQPMARMGDRISRARNAATETSPAPSANAATQVQTIAEVEPAETPSIPTFKTQENNNAVASGLQAWFESESTPDGSRFGPNRLVSQSWVLRNPGPKPWPAGCAVYFIGGDEMRNLNTNHPSSVDAMTEASRSNILEQPLEPGQTAEFKVMLKSPLREGQVTSFWRLKTADGVPFGHKLWVDITVTTSPAATPKAPATLSPALAGQPASISDTAADESAESSTMIFPKLEKESPESSIHETTQAPALPTQPAVKDEEQDLLEDIESLELDDETTEDGFMTDEEYDILNASDEDFLMEAHKAANQK